MIRISQLKMPIGHTRGDLEDKIKKELKITGEVPEYRIARQSIDARKRAEPHYSYTIDVKAKGEGQILKRAGGRNVAPAREVIYHPELINAELKKRNPVIIGAGPAGLFCAYALTQCGVPPLVLERGRRVEERARDVRRFWETGELDPSSNVQFGEGGAGAFSDGKLNTLVKDRAGRARYVLETLVRFGAPESVCYEARPHVGTDALSGIISGMRRYMEEAGAIFRFGCAVSDFRSRDGRLSAVQTADGEWIKTDAAVLAIGHSARDTYGTLHARGDVLMESKPFAVGLRIEHPQGEIGRLQYGDSAANLPPATYRVSAPANGRGVYSFCMCPGGYVINASSEEGRLAVNGMSYAARDGKNANSAIIVSAAPDDFGGDGPLSGIRFQERLEEEAYRRGGGCIPQQLLGDFRAGRPSSGYGGYKSATRGRAALCSLRGILPDEIEGAFLLGMEKIGGMMPGFDRPDAILSGVESRTSSPVRITRGAGLESTLRGLYPCGEGAGYAGGILSAAMDGLKVAEALLGMTKNA